MSTFTPRPWRVATAVVAVCGLVVVAVPEAAAAPAARSNYHIVNLTPAGITSSSVADINNRGQIAGRIEPELGVLRATTWVRGMSQQLSDVTSQASMINDRGQVLGYTEDAAGLRLVRWWRGNEAVVDERGAPTDQLVALDERGRVLLTSSDFGSGAFSASIWRDGQTVEVIGLPAPIPDTGPFAWAFPQLRDMNERGQIIGDGPAPFLGGGGSAFVWKDGVTAILPSLDGRPGTSVSALNARGQIAGNSSALDGTASHPVIWHNGRVRDLGTLPGAAFTTTQHTQQALSDNGHVIGFASSADFMSHRAWIWHRGHMTDLGDLGGTFTDPIAVNDRGRVVGSALTADGELHAFVWERGRITDLGDLGGGESHAFGINDRGDIIGESRTTDHQVHAVLWTRRRLP